MINAVLAHLPEAGEVRKGGVDHGRGGRRLLALILALAVLTGCTSTEPTVADLGRKAAALTDLMVGNDWPAVREDFDATMRQELTEDRLASAWQQVVQLKGSYQSRGEPTRVLKPGRFVVFDTPMTFERGAMKSRVTFHENGDVAGLFILVPTAG